MPEGHDIPSWLIPDDEHVIANGHEQEKIREDGELDEPLCPYCGNPYIDESNGFYIHSYVRVQKSGVLNNETTLKPGTICVSEDDKRHENGVLDTDSEVIR